MVKYLSKIGEVRLDIFKIFLWIFAVFVAITGVFSPAFMGIPLFSMFFLAFSICLSFYFLIHIQNSSELFRNRWIFVFFIFANFLISFLKGWDLFSSVYNAFLYGMPFLLLALPSYRDIRLKTCFTYVRVMVLIGAAISFSVYFGILDSKITHQNDMLNILILDNSIGLLGLIVSLYQLLDQESHYNKLVAAGYLACSYLIVIMGQSRARLILALIITMVFVLFGLMKKQKGRGKFVFFLFLFAVVAAFFIYRYYDFFIDYMNISSRKFDTIMEDESSHYRMKEIESHIMLLQEYPFTGIGCGALNHQYYTAVDDYFYGHCMLTGFFALYGLFMGMVLLGMTFAPMVRAIGTFFKNRNLTSMTAVALAGTLLFLSITSAGFAKYSTHFMMLLLGCCFAELKRESKTNLSEE